MNKIFIEAKSNKTPEYHFIRTILDLYFKNYRVDIIPMDGVDNLFNESIRNQISLTQREGDVALIVVDADTSAKKWGYAKRKAYIEAQFNKYGLLCPCFIYPDNCGDGDVEVLMEQAARRDIHGLFFDCFEDYEKCVSGKKDEKTGLPVYITPNRKGKLHTYINAQPLNSQQRRNLGAGNRLFDNQQYWDLTVPALNPLKNFFATYLR